MDLNLAEVTPGFASRRQESSKTARTSGSLPGQILTSSTQRFLDTSVIPGKLEMCYLTQSQIKMTIRRIGAGKLLAVTVSIGPSESLEMILSGDEINENIGTNIEIDPFNPENLNPNSYNLTLHHDLVTYEEVVLDMKKSNRIRRMTIPESGLVLEPNRLYLGRTVERTETHNLVPMIEGRSSIGRLGLFVHVTAGFGDVGFKGFWTLEMFAIQPVRIYPGVSICQIFYHQIKGAITEYTSGKYQNNHDIQPSLLYKELNPDAEKEDPQLSLGFRG